MKKNFPPFLLTMPEYNGTLAAARCLGEHGVPVTMAYSDLRAPAQWSRHVTTRVKAPAVAATPEAFIDWLVEFGRHRPRHVLYPTSDDLAWLFARHAGRLAPFFHLFQPSAETMMRLLDKKALHELCVDVGLPTLPLAFPADRQDVEGAGRRVGFPVVVKPRTQVLQLRLGKGYIAHDEVELSHVYRRYTEENRTHPSLTRRMPGLNLPVLQAYRTAGTDRIYSLAGFIARNGDVVARASVKLLQRPAHLGIGMCFEEAPTSPDLLRRLGALARLVGYFGVFEAEFIPDGPDLNLIDFNPRFYGQMAFEINRQLPSPYMVWLAASGRHTELHDVLRRSADWQEGRGYLYAHQSFLKPAITVRRLLGKMEPAEVAGWQERLNRGEQSLVVDAVLSRSDRLPAIASAAQEAYGALRHARSFIRTLLEPWPSVARAHATAARAR